LLDSAVDSFYPAVERLRDRLERLEDVVLDDGSDTVLRAIQVVRSDLLTIHRALWPQREMLAKILREEEPFSGEVLLFLRDVHDHAMQIVDLVETYREIGSSLMSVFLTQVSNRMNEVMKVLTMIATVFIPLSFIVGLYGMNFDAQASRWNMPELGWKYGYPAVLALMAVVVAGFVTFFVRRGWLR
jgi:magnesium transporter